MNRRPLLLAPMLLAPALAHAQAPPWRPNRPVTMIVPYAAGGGTDIVGREFAQLLSQRLGQPVVVDNRGGAGGSIGTMQAVRARPDGLTFLYAVSSNIVINPHIYRTDGQDPARVLIPVGLLANYQYILVGNPRFPAANLQELIALARQRPNEITFSHSGTGGNNHLAGRLLARMAGITLADVAYRGTAPALMDAVAGVVHFNISSPPPAISLVREGQLRPIAVTGARRSPAFPDVPTVAEQGLAGYVVTGWHGLFYPAGTPPEPVAVLRDAVQEIATLPAFHDKLGRDGLEPLVAPVSTEAFAAQVRDEHAFWGRTIPELGIRVE